MENCTRKAASRICKKDLNDDSIPFQKIDHLLQKSDVNGNLQINSSHKNKDSLHLELLMLQPCYLDILEYQGDPIYMGRKVPDNRNFKNTSAEQDECMYINMLSLATTDT